MGVFHEVVNDVTVRTGPGTNYRIAGVFRRGHTVEVVQTRQGWMRIRSGRWISADHLRRANNQLRSDGTPPISAPVRLGPQQASFTSGNREFLSPTHDWRLEPDYIDNVTRATYEPLSNTFHVYHADGSRISLDFSEINDDIATTDQADAIFPVFYRNLTNQKIYPNVFNRATTPNIAHLVNNLNRQQAAMLNVSMQALETAEAVAALRDLPNATRLSSSMDRATWSRLARDQRGSIIFRPSGSRRYVFRRLVRANLTRAENAALNQTLTHIRRGTVPTDPTVAKKWGTVFQNAEGFLPPLRRGVRYLEYRVMSAGANQNATRIVRASDGSATYYTRTHYGTSSTTTDLDFYQVL